MAAFSANLPGQPATPLPSENAGQQQPAAPPKPAKKPEEPIDPDNSAGVRGPGTTHTVRVLRKGKPAEGAHVVVKNNNGSVAATCDTSAAGECQVDVGADSYIINATANGRSGSVSLPVTDSSGPIVIKLVKVKTGNHAPKP
jgi:hypothetical protein